MEKRRVRFSNIEGLAREDIAIACEVWLDDLQRASWMAKSPLKLAFHLTRYINSPDPEMLNVATIEGRYNMDKDTMAGALITMRTYGAIDGFTIDHDGLNVALNLTFLQRLRVLEVTRAFRDELRRRQEKVRPWWVSTSEKWVPPGADDEEFATTND